MLIVKNVGPGEGLNWFWKLGESDCIPKNPQNFNYWKKCWHKCTISNEDYFKENYNNVVKQDERKEFATKKTKISVVLWIHLVYH